jgi:septal ring factor EnvC (AmiA/AmiB activator)
MDEEVVLLEEQLAAAEANVERLQSRLAEFEAKASGRENELGDMRRQLEQARRALSEQESLAVSRSGEVESLKAALAESAGREQSAASRYRELVLAREPELPADLVQGGTVDEVEESLSRARQTVAQVRQHLEQQAQALRVPSGAPVRGAPDLDALSPTEKIRQGLEER